MQDVRRTVAVVTWTMLCALAPLGGMARAQSSSLADYVAFAATELRTTTLGVASGELGAAAGPMVLRGTVSAPTSHFVSPRVAIGGTATCAGIQANDVSGATSSCPDTATPVTPPIVSDDLATVCVPPGGFSCDASKPVVVPHDTTATLPPGTYGDVIVEGGAGGPGQLRLAGDYRFCSVRVMRGAAVVFTGPSTASVAGSVTTSTGAAIVATVPASQVVVNALGPLVRFSRGSRIGARVCALTALAKGTGMELTGQLLAARIRLKRSTLVLDAVPPTTTTTSSTIATSTSTSTTSTTTPPVCGNGIREGSEECDGDDFGGLDCADFSPQGAFVGSAEGGFLSCRTDCTIDTTTCLVEICGNCIDDDGNGLTDYEDPACCAGTQRFAQVLKRGRMKANKKGGTKLKLKAVLATSGLSGVDPSHEDVFVQLRESSGDSLLCAKVPASAFRAKKRGKKRLYRFRDKRGITTDAKGLQRVAVRIDASGMVRFKARGKRTAAILPSAGPLEITVAFQPGDAEAASQCSAAVRAFRAGKRAGLKFP